MSLLFGRKSVPISQQQQILDGIPVTSSGYGQVVPILYGQQRLGVKLMGYWDFKATPVKQQSTGKGLGSASSQQKSYDYSAAVQMLLCEAKNGGIQILNVWDSKGTLALVKTTETFTVPTGGGTYQVTNHANFYLHYGVSRGDAYSVAANDFGSDGPTTLAGTQNTPMANVGSSPTAGQYTLNPATGTFGFAAGDAGKTVTITYVYSIPDTNTDGQPLADLSLTLFTGNRPQTPWAYLTSKHPGQDLAYNGMAYLANSAMDLGSSGDLPGYTYEVLGMLPFGGGIADCEPSAIVADLLTNPNYGMGWDSSFIGDFSNFANYCTANGLFFSLLLDTQQTAAQIIDDLVDLANGAAIWSEGKVKLKTYGDTTAIGNGATFVPNTQPIYDLDDDDFISKKNADPVQQTCKSRADTFNDIQVQFKNRANNYDPEIAEDKDDADIAQYGLRQDTPRQADTICDPSVAKKVANHLRLRSVYIDGGNAYKFTLGWQAVLLEPMDLVTITDPNVGLNKHPVRITSIKENETGELDFEAEDFPWGTATPTEYPHQSGSGFAAAQLVDPGSVNTPIIINATPRLTGGPQTGFEIWIAVSGANPTKWGGCNIWISADGSTYKQIGRVNAPARMGVLSAALASGSDPDTAHTLSMNLTESQGALTSGTSADADNFRTSCVIDDGSGNYEVIAYETLTLTSLYNYTSNAYLRRGVGGTPIAAHANGARFARLDDSIFKFQYDPTLMGSGLFFKFTSFNQSELREQDLADVASYTFGSPTLASPTGLTATADALGVRLAWAELDGAVPVTTYNLYRNTTNTPSTATKIASLPANGTGTQSYYDKSASVDTLYWYWITAATAGNGVESAKAGPVSSAGLGPGTHSSYRPTSNPLTATDAGSADTVNIAAFTMQIGGLALGYSSGSIASLARDTLYFIYLNDPSFVGGAVSYHATTSKANVINAYGQLFVGSIKTPKALASNTVGYGDGGSGAQYGNLFISSPTIWSADDLTASKKAGVSGWAPLGNQPWGMPAAVKSAAFGDGDNTTFGTLQIIGPEPEWGDNNYYVFISGFPSFASAWSSLALKIKTTAYCDISGTGVSIDYTFDDLAFGTPTWTNVSSYPSGTDTVTSPSPRIDAASLPVTEGTGNLKIRIKLLGVSGGNSRLDIYETWLEAQL